MTTDIMISTTKAFQRSNCNVIRTLVPINFIVADKSKTNTCCILHSIEIVNVHVHAT